MSYKLDPRIVSKLRAFAARRRRLIIIRGAAMALAMLLATMLIVAAVDYVFVLPDEVRWALSAAAYLAVIVAEWRTCLRLLAHAPGPKRLARLIEHAEPKLREDLLSAVELGTTGDLRIFDSAQFRELLQQDVAQRMDQMEVERLLPVHLVRRTLMTAGGIALVVLVLFVLTGFQLGTLMLRALMPGANLARVSKTQVEVLGPNPAEMQVPFGEAVPLLVKVTGVPARDAWMEVFTEAEGRQKVKLTAVSEDQFAGTIQVGREDLQYRVRAGDAITKKFLLDAEPRPHVVKFQKTFRLPAYTRAAPRSAVEEHGDLIALEGTEVELAIETDQPVRAAELRLEQGQRGSVVQTLLPDANGRLAGTVTLDASGSYRVHLVGAKTGFENKFSPEYELRAEPDLVPQVDLVQPRADLIVPANDLIDVVGEASDDQGLARVEQHVRINQGEWRRLQLSGESGQKASISRRWDLFDERVRAGDLIATKLVAFDLKGNRAESRTLQISITTAGVEMKRLESLGLMVNLYGSLKAWRASIEALAKAASEARRHFGETPPGDPHRAVALAGWTAADAAFEQQHTETAVALAHALRAAQPGHQSADLVVLGRLLAKTEAGTARQGRIAAQLTALDPGAGYAVELMREADDASNRAAQRARTVEESFKILLAGEEADLLAENSQIVSREQQRLLELARGSGDDPARWTQLTQRVRVVLSEIRTLEEIAARLTDRGIGGDRGLSVARDLAKHREVIEKVVADRGMSRDVLGPIEKLTEVVIRSERAALEMRGDVLQRPIEAIKSMRQDTQPTWQNFDKIATEIRHAAGMMEWPQALRVKAAEGRWQMRRDLFKTHGDLEEIRPSSDPFFVSDARAVTVALEGIEILGRSLPIEQTVEKLAALDHAFRILEGVHDLQEIYDGLLFTAIGERWQIASPKARTVGPRGWAWLEWRLKQAPDELGKLSLREEPVRKAIEDAQRILWDSQKLPAFRQIDREMKDRRKQGYTPVTARAEADTLAQEVKRAIELLRPHVDAARAQVAAMAPNLSDIAKALAEETRKLKEETLRQEDEAKKQPGEAAKAEAEQALAQQQKLNEKIESLKDLLRADANQQSLMQAEGRERARDADDALAMLKEPPPKAANALSDAAEAQTGSAQEQALARAAEQQQKLEKALEQIAGHYEAMEQGADAGESRLALRAMEEELGIKEMLDQQYARAEQLAQLASSSPQEMLRQLEQALPQNPVMQQELSGITQNTLADAQKRLEQASKSENKVAEQISELAKAQPQASQEPEAAQQNPMSAADAAKQAAKAAEAAQQAAQQAQKNAREAGSETASNQAQQAANEAGKAAEAAQQAAKSAEKMAQAAEAGQMEQARSAAQQAAQKAGEAAGEAEKAMASAEKAQASAQQAEAGSEPAQAAQQQAAQQSGEAAKSASEAAQAAKTAQAAAQKAAQAMQAAPQLAQAAQQQPPIAQQAAQAGAEVARAGRHEERLQNQRAGEQLQQLGAEIAETASAKVPAAEQALSTAQAAAQAQPAVQTAADELAREAAMLAQAASGQMLASESTSSSQEASSASQAQQGEPQQSSASQPASQNQAQSPASQPGEGSPQPASSPAAMAGSVPATPQEQAWMARTLDALDAALNSPAMASAQGEGQPSQQGQPGQEGQQGQQQPGQGQPSGQQQAAGEGQGQTPSPSMAQAQSALQQAAAAAAQAMRAARSESVAPVPGMSPAAQGDQQPLSQGALAQSGDLPYGATPEARGLREGDWGKLPKRMAEQLSRGQAEAVPPEYRTQIETYYRVIAERAKQP